MTGVQRSGIERLSDDALLDLIQQQTLAYFWDFAHPVSGLARERDNTVRAEYYWDYINEADGEPNFSKDTFGPEACAIGGTGFGICLSATTTTWSAGMPSARSTRRSGYRGDLLPDDGPADRPRVFQ